MDRNIRHRFSSRASSVEVMDNNTEIEKLNHNKITRPLSFIKITLLITILLFPIIFVVIPFIVRSSPTIQQMALFLNYANLRLFYNLSDPLQFEIRCARSFFIESDDGMVLGTWHIFPNENETKCSKKTSDFDDNKLVVLYSHGNSGTRASKHRISLYKLLSNHLDAHVIAFDYRGYGDSTNVSPSAQGTTNDTKNVYEWLIRQNVSSKRILIWGHSLGTAIIARFLSQCPNEIYPTGAVFEAGFTSLYEESQEYPLIKMFSFLPYFKYCFVDPIVENENFNFNTTALLSSIKCPLLILHAQDDFVVPFEIGQRLHQQAVDLQPEEVIPRAKLVSYPIELGYGHKNINHDPNLSNIIKSFVDSSEQKAM